MAEPGNYRLHFTEQATEFVLSLPKRKQRVIMDRCHELARYPFIESDYQLTDDEGTTHDHLLIGDVVYTYWPDHAKKTLVILQIDRAD